MKNFPIFEPYTLVLDSMHSNEWVATMLQLMKLAGNSLYQHSLDVAFLTANMALYGNEKILSQSDIALSSLLLGALLHDIGYIGLPSTVKHIQPEHNLSPIAQAAFDIHLSNGIEQVRLHLNDPIVLEIISMHHECLDGSGMPGHIQASQIPIHVRMVSLANFLINYVSTSLLPSNNHPKHYLTILCSLLHNKTLRQKYDISLLQNYLRALGVYRENHSTFS